MSDQHPDELLDLSIRLQQASTAYNNALYDVLAKVIERSSEMAASAVLQFIGTQQTHTELINHIIENQADKRMILRDINERLNVLEAQFTQERNA
jgi:hypothetical protein